MNRCSRCFGDPSELADLAVFCPYCGQVREPDFDKLIGTIIDDRFRIDGRLGQGGLSTVFAATDLNSGQAVVIKVSDPAQLARREMSYSINSEEARNYWAEMLERMRREAETLATIDHDNLVRFYGTGLINSELRYVAMEFLDGRTLREEMDLCGSIEIARAVRIATDISRALSEVHARGIIHRDINPNNIFIVTSGDADQDDLRIKLIDFGIAKFPTPPGAPPFTQHSVSSGTVSYSSPEQCQSRPLDNRTDIYSLGIVIYEMVAGYRPFTGRTTTEIALKQIQTPPAPPSSLNPAITQGLENAILRALAKNPDERQQTAGELANDLIVRDSTIIIPLYPEYESEDTAGIEDTVEDDFELKRVRRRRRRLAVAIAALIPVMAAAGFLFARQWINPQRAIQNISELLSATPTPNATVTPSASPGVTGSDADSLELAARMSAQSQPPQQSQPTPQIITEPIEGQASAKQKASSTPAIQKKPITQAASKPTHEPAAAAAKPVATPPPPRPRYAGPQYSPSSNSSTNPSVAASKLPQPSSQPDAAQAPRKVEQRREEADLSRDRDKAPSSNNDRPLIDVRRQEIPSTPRQEIEPPRRNIGPKLIQWSGSVNRVREITIEMPGAPGTIEIPRIYRDRVGVVEPPSSSNGWDYAVLRIFGRGNVSIIIRWWPMNGMSAQK